MSMGLNDRPIREQGLLERRRQAVPYLRLVHSADQQTIVDSPAVSGRRKRVALAAVGAAAVAAGTGTMALLWLF